MQLKSYAKVNLSLNIVGKFRSKKHKIESLVSFLDFYDLNDSVECAGVFVFVLNIFRNSRFSRLLRVVDFRNFIDFRDISWFL